MHICYALYFLDQFFLNKLNFIRLAGYANSIYISFVNYTFILQFGFIVKSAGSTMEIGIAELKTGNLCTKRQVRLVEMCKEMNSLCQVQILLILSVVFANLVRNNFNLFLNLGSIHGNDRDYLFDASAILGMLVDFYPAVFVAWCTNYVSDQVNVCLRLKHKCCSAELVPLINVNFTACMHRQLVWNCRYFVWHSSICSPSSTAIIKWWCNSYYCNYSWSKTTICSCVTHCVTTLSLETSLGRM